ncbi:helical backbone metal receptor [Castellaniella sp. S9]|uniref:helical backbone metal receptor n=1 Tax=Castellaniella sp. S9 TaxID=2993652 RepID=UPI0022B2E23F|nr:helical backbone metal receptor [Castellaniella sp. S9]
MKAALALAPAVCPAPVARGHAGRTAARRLAAVLAAILLLAGPFAPAGAEGTPHRVITLAPSVTELVYAAGGGADIVGTVLSSDYPPAARDIPRIGDGIQFDQETILALRPTLVVGWLASGGSQALAAVLRNLGVPMIYADPRSLDDIPGLIRALGRHLDTSPAADRAAAALRARIDALHAPAGRPLTVFIEVGVDPLYTLGKDPLVDDLLARCGGVNPYADRAVAAPQASVESVLRIDPDVVIVSPYGRQTLAARSAYWTGLGLRAAMRGHLYAIDPDWLHRPGPRLVDAAEALCADLDRVRADLGH